MISITGIAMVGFIVLAAVLALVVTIINSKRGDGQ